MKSWSKPALVYLLACFTVFVLPFFFPPKLLLGISVSNQVGFNNKVATAGAACIAFAVFLYSLIFPRVKSAAASDDAGPLSRRLVLVTTIACALLYSVLAVMVVLSHARYTGDAGYFIEQINSYVEYGRLPYQQVEFPYGPILFYLPVVFYRVLSLFHRSLTTAYFVTLIVEHTTGLLCVAYLIDRLPMARRAKDLIYLATAFGAIQFNLGPNYSYFRFALPPALLLFAMRRRSPWSAASALLVGQLVSLGISSELGFAYAAGAFVYGCYKVYKEGRAWVASAVAPIAGSIAFFFIVGRPYIAMLQLFAGGIYNFPVEPLPHILLFLIPLVLINPYGLAVFIRARRPEAPILTALCVFSVALLPVAFGRADPGHVANDGLLVLLLSLVFIPIAPRTQRAWTIAAALFFVYATCVNVRAFLPEVRLILPQAFTGYPFGGTKDAARTLLRTRSWSKAKARITHTYTDPLLDIAVLQRIVGNDPVTTPYSIPLLEEEKLQRAGLYEPTFYCFMIAVLDRTAEDHAINEFNQRRWLLVQSNGGDEYLSTETVANTKQAMGFQITYPSRHPAYVVGVRTKKNLDTNWYLRERIGEYLLYERR